MITKVTSYIVLALLAVGLIGPTRSAFANGTDVKINLVAAPAFQGAKGTARYRDRAGEKELQVEVEARRLAGTVLTVVVNDQNVGTIMLDAFGKGRLSLNSHLGQVVPTIVPGSLVGVTTAGGDIVLAGKF